jgi:hypothetical protein
VFAGSRVPCLPASHVSRGMLSAVVWSSFSLGTRACYQKTSHGASGRSSGERHQQPASPLGVKPHGLRWAVSVSATSADQRLDPPIEVRDELVAVEVLHHVRAAISTEALS